jgi:hypothetical protein
LDALGTDTSGKTVLGVVGSFDDLIIVRKSEDLHDWAEDFFSSDFHVVSDISENGWFNKVTGFTDSVTTTEESSTFILTTLDVGHNFVKLSLTDLWTLHDIVSEWITDDHSLSSGNGFFTEFIVDVVMDKQSGSSAAALTLVEEKSNMRLLNGHIDVSIVANDIWRFSTKFKSDSLKVVWVRVSHDLVTGCSGTSECNFLDAWMSADGLANVSHSWKNLDNSVWESNFSGPSTNLQCSQGGPLSWFQN